MTDTTTQVTAPAAPLTGREKLVAAYNALATKRADLLKKADEIAVKQSEIAVQVQTLDALASIGENSPVRITVGKGEAAKEVEGVVIAVRELEDGSKEYKVKHGTGFDTDHTIVKGNKLKLPNAEPVAQAETEQA